MKIDLTDRRVLITGASRGIGKAIARRFVESGAVVAAHYRAGKAGAQQAIAGSPDSVTLGADLSSPDAAAALFRDAVSVLGHVDCLVNNCGVAMETALDASDEQWLASWNATINVNLRAAAILSRAAVNHFRSRGGGHLVHVASRAAFRGDTMEYLAYAASKGGMVALSRSIARGAGTDGVKSFVIAPGFVKTDMAAAFLEKYGADLATHDIALDRATEPDDVAPLAVFLASGLADHATGTTIDVNAASYVR